MVADRRTIAPEDPEVLNSILVVGPSVGADPDSLQAIASRGIAVVVLTPVPEARANGVTEVAMELSGRGLREAVRRAAATHSST